jgi:hypothetical protein
LDAVCNHLLKLALVRFLALMLSHRRISSGPGTVAKASRIASMRRSLSSSGPDGHGVASDDQATLPPAAELPDGVVLIGSASSQSLTVRYGRGVG